MTSLVHKLVFAWFSHHQRDLPWRARGDKVYRDPYRILVSELMLQQTQVSRVIPLFQAFCSKWPTVQDLAAATLAEVLIAWQGLGYNRRAKHLLETAKIITHTYQGIFPQDLAVLQSLPGLGSYTSAAIAVFAFNQQIPVIDVNVRRVLSRVFTSNETLPQRELTELAWQTLPLGQADAWGQALMDFGATVCSSTPHCGTCVLARICRANTAAREAGFEDYAQYLRSLPKTVKKTGKDVGKRFEETDRYFRGRIIHLLRGGKLPMEEVWQHLQTHHHLADRRRFGNIIEQLVVDHLIEVEGNQVQLPGLPS